MEIDARPTRIDLRLYAGDGFSFVLRYPEDTDVTDRTYAAAIKAERGAAADVAAAFTEDRPAANEVRFSLAGEDTESLPPSGVWDLEETSAGRTLVTGNVAVQDQVL